MDIDSVCSNPNDFGACVLLYGAGSAGIDPSIAPFVIVGCYLKHCPSSDGDDEDDTAGLASCARL
jgi:hypothetical protein